MRKTDKRDVKIQLALNEYTLTGEEREIVKKLVSLFLIYPASDLKSDIDEFKKPRIV